MTEPWALYPRLRDRMIALVHSTSEADLARTVPSTPGWTVAGVVAHVCGLNADIVAGAFEDLGSDERTSAQVASRRHMTVEAVCEEWVSHDDAMRSVAAEVPLLEERLAADLVIHLQDVQHALGHEIDTEDAATISAAHVYANRSIERWRELVGTPVRVELSDGFVAGDPSADLVLRATPYDFMRSVSGRRSRAQVEALDWSGDAGAVTDHFSPYAQLGAVDAAV